MPTTPDQNSDFIEDSPSNSLGVLHILVWAALLLATWIILNILIDIAALAAPRIRHAAFGAAILTTALAAAPFIRFILVMWNTRFEEISNRLNDSALAAYLVQFWERRFIDAAPSLQDDLATYRLCGKLLNDKYADQASALFKTIYNEQYGKAAFVTPVILVLATVAIETMLVVFVATGHIALHHQPFALQMLGAAAGTYMFVVGDSVMAARRRSLNISDVYWYALRLVLAVPLGLAIYKIGGDMMGAFVLGTLPIDQFRKVLARYAGANFTDLERQVQEPDQLIQLDGVTGDISAQLGLEGITSIEQLVGTDPVSLAIRTGLPFKLILRLGSQAIVRRHLRMNAGPLAGIGLADAEPIARLLRDLQSRYKVPLSPADDTPSTALWLQDARLLADPVILNALGYINDAAAAQTAPPRTAMTAQTLLTACLRISDESYTKFLMVNDGNNVCSVPGCTPTARICAPNAPLPESGALHLSSALVRANAH